MMQKILKNSKRATSLSNSPLAALSSGHVSISTYSKPSLSQSINTSVVSPIFGNNTFASYATQVEQESNHLQQDAAVHEDTNESNVDEQAVEEQIEKTEETQETHTRNAKSTLNQENPWEQNSKELYSPHMPLSEMFQENRSQKEVILDFTTYILPNVLNSRSPYKLLARYLRALGKNHPQSVLVIYDEFDQNIKKKYFLYFSDPVCNALLKIGKPEVVQRLLKNRNEELKSISLVRISITTNVRLGNVEEAVRLFETHTYSSKEEKYFTYYLLLHELIDAKEKEVLRQVYLKHKAELFIPTPKLLNLIYKMLERGLVAEAKFFSKTNTKRALIALERGIITKEDIQKLETRLAEAESSSNDTESQSNNTASASNDTESPSTETQNEATNTEAFKKEETP